jgi:hypothetical protein
MVLVVVAFFLTFGVPRWFSGDAARVTPRTDLAQLCRDHGGTPAAPARRAGTSAQGSCTVRYGRRVYRMDAVTPAGFDADTARFQRQGCEEAGREQRAQSARAERRRSFVYHPLTGVCEHGR